MNEQLIEFAKDVKELRTTQKNYFRFKRKSDLEKSKLLEQKIDRLIEGIVNPTQGKLFE